MKAVPYFAALVFLLLFLEAHFEAEEARSNTDKAIQVAKDWKSTSDGFQELNSKNEKTARQLLEELNACIHRHD